MPNIAKVLKEEIQRLAKKEVKAAVGPLRKDNARLKRAVSEHKRRIAKLEQNNRHLSAHVERQRRVSPKAGDKEVQQARITAKMILSIRDRFRLAQADLAKLVNVSPQTVYLWEQRKGRLKFRGDTKTAIVGLRGMKVREVEKRLEELREKK